MDYIVQFAEHHGGYIKLQARLYLQRAVLPQDSINALLDELEEKEIDKRIYQVDLHHTLVSEFKQYLYINSVLDAVWHVMRDDFVLELRHRPEPIPTLNTVIDHPRFTMCMLYLKSQMYDFIMEDVNSLGVILGGIRRRDFDLEAIKFHTKSIVSSIHFSICIRRVDLLYK